jgi:MtrB/PioB family decaheme-associated outer membrane protein
MTMRTPVPAFLIVCAVLAASRVEAADTPAVDTTKWPCKFCPADEGLQFTPDLGVGYVSEDSAKFGEYSGLNEQGTYVVADAEGRYRNKNGTWIDLSAMDLGLDSRYFGVEGGKQGRYELHLSYKELPHHLSDTSRSPYLGVRGASLTLPAGWVPSATTDTMGALDQSLRRIDLETQRKQLELGGSLLPVKHWAFGVNFRHEEKDGARAAGAAFVFNAARLPVPIDYTTDQFDASASYSREAFQARFAYYGSIFRNDDAALSWTNPYLPFTSGGTTGQLALAPDNEFHQLLASAGYRFDDRTQLTAELATGRMTQDEAFLPYTVNPDLSTQPLPRDSLDGRVDTLDWSVKFNTTPTDKLRLNAAIAYDERDNRTPQASYAGVTTDSGLAAPRTNFPYSFAHSRLSADAAYAFMPWLRMYAGCALEQIRRDLQEVARTREGSCWGKASLAAKDIAEISLKWTHAERTGSGYQPNPGDAPAQNSLMRLYNLADRDRDEVKLRVDFAPGARFNFGIDGNVTWDSYYNSAIGLTDGRSWAAAADCTWAVSQKFSANCYLAHERIESNQANAALLAPTPQWFGDGTDTTDSAGAGLRYAASGKLDLGLDYTWSRSTGEIVMRNATSGFPDLDTRLDSVRLYANYWLRKNLSLRLAYWYESYRSDDWQLDEVTPATISNVLTLGDASPAYDVNVIALSGRYEF